MRLTHNNHEQVMQLFNTYMQERIERMNSRIMGEHARNPNFHWSNRIEGLEYNHYELWSTRTIDLPEGAEEAMITLAREAFTTRYGMSDARGQDGERMRLLMHSFLPDVAVNDRHAAIRQMSGIFLEETNRIFDTIRQAVPTWTPGQRVSSEILDPILNGHGGNVNITA